jgi:hypothetical protein
MRGEDSSGVSIQTQDLVLSNFQPSLRDWHPLLLGNLEDGQAPHALSGRREDGVRYGWC